jgi:vacuolar-type H+-ATPase subunit D/Vma8
MIESPKQYEVTKIQLRMLQTTVANYDINLVAKKIGSVLLAETEFKALKSQVQELEAEIKEYEIRVGIILK